MFNAYKKDMKDDLIRVLFPGLRSKKNNSEDSKSKDWKTQKQKLTTALDQAMFCLQPAVRSLITVFNLEANSNLSEAIFESICKCKLNIF